MKERNHGDTEAQSFTENLCVSPCLSVSVVPLRKLASPRPSPRGEGHQQHKTSPVKETVNEIGSLQSKALCAVSLSARRGIKGEAYEPNANSKQKTTKAFLTFLFLSICFFLHAQDVRFTFDKQKILLGEPMQMKIETLLGNGENTVHLDTIFSPDSLPHFEVLDRGKIDTSNTNAGIYFKQIVTLTSWDSGSWQLPTVNRNGIGLQPATIEVGYTSPWDVKQPYHDIKGIIPVKHPGQTTWWWYVIGAAVLIGLFLLFFPKGKKGETVSQLDSNAYKKAMQQLDELQKKNITDSKQYYTELINIFRTYLKGAKGIQSFTKTTDDLSIQLQGLKLSQERYNSLVQTLRLSDLVKFAQYKPDATAAAESFNTIKQSTTIIEGHAV